MTMNGWIQIALYAALVTVCVKPLGIFMAKVFEGERTFLTPVFRPVERTLYAIGGVNEKEEQHWVTYTVAMLLFSIVSFLAVYALQRLQGLLPFNPQGLGAVSPDSSFNTAVSFATNTNWQGYGGETTMSYLVQMAGLTVQNFVSAATGIALAIALIRGFARRSAKTVGNFWVDLTRCTLYILLPMSIVLTLVLVGLGVPQNLGTYTDATTLEGAKQVIAQGPAASQIAIKQLGTNGGGFFNVNSAHPFENPNAISNLIEMWAILVISAALTYTFGRMVKNTRQGWAIFAVMGVLYLAGPDRPSPIGRKARAIRPLPQPTWIAPQAPCKRAAIWRARRSASESPIRPSGQPRRPTPRMARSIPCMTVLRRSAESYPSSICNWGRSSSAASVRAFTGCCCSRSSRCSLRG